MKHLDPKPSKEGGGVRSRYVSYSSPWGRDGLNGLLEIPSSPVFCDSVKTRLQWLLAVQIAGDKLLSSTCECFMAVFIALVDAVLQEKR